MSRDEFETFLKLVGKLLRFSPDQQQQLNDELRDHLELRTADLMAEGLTQQQAIGQAVDEFGDAALMADNFRKISQLKRKRWIMKLTSVSMVTGFVACLLVLAMWPENTRLGVPDQAIAQDATEQADLPGLGSILKESIQRELGEVKGTQQQNHQPLKIGVRYFVSDEKIERALKQTVNLQYDDEEWAQIADAISRRYCINLLVNPTADDELRADDILSVSVRQVTLEAALSWMLLQKGCTLCVKNGVLLVIRNDDIDNFEFAQTRIYDCRKLLEKIDLQRSHLKTVLTLEEQSTHRHRRISSATEFLINLVSDAVPKKLVAGEVSTITIVNGNLIVVGNRDLLNNIERFLQLLADGLGEHD